MNAASSSNGSGLDTPRPTAPNSYGKLTEGEFLAHEAQIAKTAIATTLGELTAELARAGDVRLWTYHHPWAAVGVAAASGFTLAAVVKNATAETREPEQLDGDDRERLLREIAKAPYNNGRGAATKPKLGDTLIGSLFSLARTALEASLISAIRAEGIERVHAEAAARAAAGASADAARPCPSPMPAGTDPMTTSAAL